jgi:allantoate deiminase
VLGVMIAIAVANELGNAALPFHLDVIGFSEEEGVRYGMPYLGSSAVAGQFQPQWLERTDANGVAMRDAIATFGLDPARIEQAPYRRDEVIGFVEPHLEQGPILDGAGAPVGVVTAIAGQSRLRLEYSGESGHAGATPMGQRRDALVSAAQFVAAVRAVGRRIDGLRATIGRLLVEPGASNVIPGRVELSLDLRHVDDAVREAVLAEILEVGHRIALSDDVSFRVLEQNAESAVAIDGKLRQQIEEAVADVGCKSMHLASWAGHDAVAMAKLFPIAMRVLFDQRRKPWWQNPRVEGIADRNGPLLMKVVVERGRNPFPVVHRHDRPRCPNSTSTDGSSPKGTRLFLLSRRA